MFHKSLTRSRVVSSALLLLVLGVTRPLHAGGADSSLQERYANAYAALGRSDWHEARRLFLDIWKESPTYDVAAALGEVDFELGRFASSGKFVAFAIEHSPPSTGTKKLEAMRKRLEEIKGLVGVLQVTVNEANAEILVDSEVVGRSPVDSEIFLDIGPHTVQAKLDGRVAEQTVDATGGSKHAVDLRLEPAPVPATPALQDQPRSSGATTNDESSGRSRVPLYIGIAVTGVALATGAGFAISAENHRDDYSTLEDKVGSRGCLDGTASPADCSAIQDAKDTVNSHSTIANVSFVLGALAGAATLTYFFWPESSEDKPGVRASAAFGPSGGSIAISHVF